MSASVIRRIHWLHSTTGFLVLLVASFGPAWRIAPVRAQAESDEVEAASLVEQAQQWVRQLNDRELARRQEAERQLLELGPAVLDVLPEESPRMSAEVRQRLARIRTELERALGADVTRETTVTLSGSHPMSEVLDKIMEQTGNRVRYVPQPDQEVTVDFSDTPYWEALDQLLDQFGLTVDPYGGDPEALVLRSRNPAERDRRGAAKYHQAFRIEATRIAATRDLRNPELQGLRVGMSVAWEPRLAPIVFIQADAKLSAEDEQGNAIMAGSDRPTREIPVHTGMSAIEFEVPLTLPPPGATHLARLQGELEALIPGRVESFEFDGNLQEARGVQQRRAGVMVQLDNVRRNVDLYQFQVRVRFDDASGALESHRGWIFNNEASIVDAEGNRVPPAGLEATRQTENEVGISYLFDLPDGLDGCRFVYKTPAVLNRYRLPFELQDLPLP